jgi:hypothetical protein
MITYGEVLSTAPQYLCLSNFTYLTSLPFPHLHLPRPLRLSSGTDIPAAADTLLVRLPNATLLFGFEIAFGWVSLHFPRLLPFTLYIYHTVLYVVFGSWFSISVLPTVIYAAFWVAASFTPRRGRVSGCNRLADECSVSMVYRINKP